MRRDADLEATIVAKYAALAPVLDERSRRWWAAAESSAIGYGGDALVSSATGLARETIRKGRWEIARGQAPTGRIRRPGAGRPGVRERQPSILVDLEAFVDPLTRGDQASPLRWTCKSRATLAAMLTEHGLSVSSTTVGRLLRHLGYRLRSARRRRKKLIPWDRNEQFEYINATADRFLTAGQPVISVDITKQDLVANSANARLERRAQGRPAVTSARDFPRDAEGEAIPYDAYDMDRDESWVRVARTHDIPAVAVKSIHHWWQRIGRIAFPDAKALYITADAGGSAAYRSRLGKREFQPLADNTRLTIYVSHFPPGTRKWTKIDHRLFCHITVNSPDATLTAYETIVDRIGSTRRDAGGRVQPELDAGRYSRGAPVTEVQMDTIVPMPGALHGNWNYRLAPR